MNLRSKVIVSLIFSFAAVGALVFLGWRANTALTQLQADLSKSLMLEEAVKNGVLSANIKDVQSLTPPHRRIAYENLIKAQANKRTQVVKEMQFLDRVEADYRIFLMSHVQYQQKKIELFISLALAILGITLAFMSSFMIFKVLRPIRHLSGRMQDFRKNQYSYEFKTPSQDEVGKLEESFNELAQGVISNVEALKSLDQAKSDFLSIASHELRTPMTSIKGSLSLLQMGIAGSLSDSALNLLQIAEKETDRLIRLINDLLDLAKIEARQFRLKKEWQHLDEVVSKTVASLEGLSQSSQVSIQASVPETYQVNIDADRFQQVLTNLLSNAIKFSPQGGVVCVEVNSSERDEIMILVKDQGPGIAPADQELIFDKFRQATSPQNPLVKGTGLGLAIAKALIEEHGGQIGVRSVVGQGCTFYFTLKEWRFAIKDNKRPSPGVAA